MAPGRNHLSSLLRDGSSGGDHSSPSLLTVFAMTRMSSSSALGLALRDADDSKRVGSVNEPDNSSASEARQRKAVIQFVVTRTERDHVARSRGGTLIVLGEENWRMLSLW